MTKINKYIINSLVFSLLCLSISFVGGAPFQNIIGVLLIGSIGLLHGANDLKIIERLNSGFSITHKNAWIGYIIVMGLVLLGFFFIQKAALFFFIGISSYHFGQQHLHLQSTTFSEILMSFSYGLLIFAMLFFIHYESSSLAIQQVSGVLLKREWFIYTGVAACLIWFLLSISLKYSGWRGIAFEFLILGFLAITFSRTTLLLSFGIYFAFWHALPSLEDQMRILYPSHEGGRLNMYVKHALPFWIASVAFLLGVMFFSRKWELNFLPLLVYFLACITFPHVIVMSRVEKALRS